MKCIDLASFTCKGVTVRLILEEEKSGPVESDYVVFTRIEEDFDLDDVDIYNRRESALAKFMYICSKLLLGS